MKNLFSRAIARVHNTENQMEASCNLLNLMMSPKVQK